MTQKANSKKIVALIPARGGSKGIPAKNIKKFAGRPLVDWVLQTAVSCRLIDEVWMSTEASPIMRYVHETWHPKVKCILRHKNLARDDTPMSDVMVNFSDNVDFDVLVVIQPTSPLLEEYDLSEGIRYFTNHPFDSVTSGVRQKRFCWRHRGDFFYPVMHDPDYRPNRQDYDGFLVENGAFVIVSRDNLLRYKKRLCGRVGIYEMPEYTYTELDEEHDWIAAEALAKWVKEKN